MARKHILVIDVGGTQIKLLASGQKERTRLPSGSRLSPRKLVKAVQKATKDWKYDVISIGVPAPVTGGRVADDPVNLGRGWKRFDFEKAFGKPVRVMNDAAMQALGSYDGGRMLFIGLGTGLGSALIVDDVLAPLELAHMPYRDGRDFEYFVGTKGLERLGHRRWLSEVKRVVGILRIGMQADYVVIGGGNVKELKKLPPYSRAGSNRHAFAGGFLLWNDRKEAKRILKMED